MPTISQERCSEHGGFSVIVWSDGQRHLCAGCYTRAENARQLAALKARQRGRVVALAGGASVRLSGEIPTTVFVRGVEYTVARKGGAK